MLIRNSWLRSGLSLSQQLAVIESKHVRTNNLNASSSVRPLSTKEPQDELESKSSKKFSKIYQRLTPIEHVLKRPEVYIGPTDGVKRVHWVPNILLTRPGNETQAKAKAKAPSHADPDADRDLNVSQIRFESKILSFIPGLYKIFDEILVNATDNALRGSGTKHIDVNISVPADLTQLKISVRNDGRPPPIVMHDKENVLIPEMIFGTLLTGSNFGNLEKRKSAQDVKAKKGATSVDKRETHLTGGRHGYGAKLANIMSTEFSVHIVDKDHGKSYSQTWKSNMHNKSQALVQDDTPLPRGFNLGMTRVEFVPELSRFGLDRVDKDILLLMERRVWDVAASLSSKKVRVKLNGFDLSSVVKDFEHYAKMHGSPSLLANEQEAPQESSTGLFSVVSGKTSDYEFAVRLISPEESSMNAPPVSFVNCVTTFRGGSHVDAVLEQIASYLSGQLDKVSPELSDAELDKDKKPRRGTSTTSLIKSNTLLFLNAFVNAPHFDSQSKELLTSRHDLPKLTTRTLVDIYKQTGILAMVAEHVKLRSGQNIDKLMRQGQKTVKEETLKRLAYPKLEDATHAGTRNSTKCTLILTEGDSAKALAMSGISLVGREQFGVFPLRGKLLNVRECSGKLILNNAEIMAVINILGLNNKADYSDPNNRKRLRYGKLLIMSDQDHDGDHIKGLVLNMLDSMFPSILKSDPNFVHIFNTPLIKVFGPRGKVHEFFSVSEFNAWAESNPTDSTKARVKYYKGLGTSTREEAREYFRNIDTHVVEVDGRQKRASDLLDMAFNKHRASDRKLWLLETPQTRANGESLSTEHGKPKSSLLIQDFVNTRLRDFSNYGNTRSIPSMVDGLKPSQRKVLHSCLKRGLDKENAEMKVAQLAAYVAENTEYRHGEAAMHTTIIRMAQNFVGVNNVPILEPIGQFGTRLTGGDDAAAPRYIYTKLNPLINFIYRKEDQPILRMAVEDGVTVEPTHYIPIVPMVLVNGATGIGIGWSTDVPPFRLTKIVDNVKKCMESADPSSMEPMVPYYRGFQGQIILPERTSEYFENAGVLEQTASSNIFRIRELPVGLWTGTYREFLDSKLVQADPMIESVVDFYTDTEVGFEVKLTPAGMIKFGFSPSSSFSPSLSSLSATPSSSMSKLMDFLKLRTRISMMNMHAFDADGVLRKYASPQEIIQAFVPIRRHAYSLRKEYLSNVLAQRVNKLKNQCRFIQLIQDKELSLVGKPLDNCVSQLRNAKLDSINDDDELPSSHGFQYLLKMSFTQCSKENFDVLTNQYEATKKELDILRSRSEEDQWMLELDELVAQFLQWEAGMERSERLTAVARLRDEQADEQAGRSEWPTLV